MILIAKSNLAWLLCAALLMSSCSLEEESTNDQPRPSSNGNDSIQWVDPETLRPGPIRRNSLTDEQMARIRTLQEIFVEVDGRTVDQWIDNFKRDIDPDRELDVWERMAKAYERYCSMRDLSPDAKKEVYKVVLLRSMTSEDGVLLRIDLKVISKDDAIEVMKGFTR